MLCGWSCGNTITKSLLLLLLFFLGSPSFLPAEPLLRTGRVKRKEDVKDEEGKEKKRKKSFICLKNNIWFVHMYFFFFIYLFLNIKERRGGLMAATGNSGGVSMANQYSMGGSLLLHFLFLVFFLLPFTRRVRVLYLFCSRWQDPTLVSLCRCVSGLHRHNLKKKKKKNEQTMATQSLTSCLYIYAMVGRAHAPTARD